MFFYAATIETKSSTEQNKEKQTFGGDHIFHEDSASNGNWGAENFSPLAPPELQGRLANRIPSICALTRRFTVLLKYFHIF